MGVHPLFQLDSYTILSLPHTSFEQPRRLLLSAHSLWSKLAVFSTVFKVTITTCGFPSCLLPRML